MRNAIGRYAVLALIAVAACGLAGQAGAARLPRHAPLPEAAPRLVPPEKPAADRKVPVPEAREQPRSPDIAPIPGRRPQPPHEAIGTLIPPLPGGTPASPPAVPESRNPGMAAVVRPVPPELHKGILRPTPPPPPARLACLADLRKLGVRFEEHAPLSDPVGCSVPNPVAVSALSSSIRIGPDAVMNCALADELARFVRDTASPIAEEVFGSPIASITQASAYVCRDRHGTSKISEHAFGNAIDIADFVLEDGARIEVRDYGDSDPKRATFLNEVRRAACGPFRTVLGPGADADHRLHFHFDLEPRKSRTAFCQ
jgi:hypothetical protein